MTEPQLLRLLKIQSNLGPADFENIFKDQDRARHLFNLYARDSWNLISFMFNKVNGEDRERLLSYINEKNAEFNIEKTKCIEVITTDTLGFQQMSSLKKEISDLVDQYQADYQVNYYFK